MARTSSYLGSPKAIAAGVVQTLTWNSGEIDSAGVIGFFLSFGLTAAGFNPISSIDRVRVRAGGQLIMEANLAQLLAFQAHYSRSNFFNSTASAATGESLTIPLNLMDGPTMEARDQCQFPPGAEAQMEVVTTTGALAGQAFLAWTVTNQPPVFFQRLVTAQSNIPAGVGKNGKFTFSDSGIIRALIFPVLGVDRAELTISGQRAWNMPAQGFQNRAAGSEIGDLLVEKDQWEDAPPPSVLTNRVHRVDLMLPAANGVSNLILDTSNTWVGPTNEIAVYSVDKVENFRGRA
jgi:hypothetical protein